MTKKHTYLIKQTFETYMNITLYLWIIHSDIHIFPMTVKSLDLKYRYILYIECDS